MSEGAEQRPSARLARHLFFLRRPSRGGTGALFGLLVRAPDPFMGCVPSVRPHGCGRASPGWRHARHGARTLRHPCTPQPPGSQPHKR